MRFTRHTFRLLAVCALTIAFLVPAAAAFADRGVVPNNAYVNGVALKGKTESQARSIVSAVPVTKLVVTGAGKTHTLWSADVKKALSVSNVNSVLDQAYASRADTTTAYTITRSFAVNTTVVGTWSKAVAKKIDRSSVNSKYVAKKRKLKVTASRTGYKVSTSTTTSRIKSALLSAAGAGKSQAKAYASVKVNKPKVTKKNIGKAILVVQKYRRLYLYDDGKKVKSYRCAIGTSSHPTPNGTFKIVSKRYRPTWVNPAPNGWGANMPASIAPGPNNPLGLRALNLNVSGIRIHGTSNIGSLGHRASHGCIRLANSNIVKLYKRVKVGTPVFIVK